MCNCENEINETNGTIQEKPFQPDLAGLEISKHVKRTFWQWLSITAIFWTIGVFVLINYKDLSPHDPDVLLRWLSEGYIHLVYALGLAFGVICFVQWWTNGNLVGRILSDAKASAILFASVFLGVVLLLIGC